MLQYIISVIIAIITIFCSVWKRWGGGGGGGGGASLSEPHTRRRRIREPRYLLAPLSMVEVSVRRLPGQFLDVYRCFSYLNNYSIIILSVLSLNCGGG